MDDFSDLQAFRDTFAGKHLRSDESQELLNSYGVEPETRIQGNCRYYDFFTKGISIDFFEDRLQGISFYGEGVNGYRQFRGRLPCEITFMSRRSDVIRKFGRPDRVVPSLGNRDNYEYSLIAYFEDVNLQIGISSDSGDQLVDIVRVMVMPSG